MWELSDAATGAPLWQAPTGTHPYAVAFHAGRFWTADVQSDSVTVIDETPVEHPTVVEGDADYLKEAVKAANDGQPWPSWQFGF